MNYEEMNRMLLHDEEEYNKLVLSFVKEFDSVESLEYHFLITPPDEESQPEEYENGVIQIETMQHKPKRYPCIYVYQFCECGRCWADYFIYPEDFGRESEKKIDLLNAPEIIWEA